MLNAKDLQTFILGYLLTGSAIISLDNILPLEGLSVNKNYTGLTSGLTMLQMRTTYSDTVDIITKSIPTLTISNSPDSISLSVQSVDTTMSLTWKYNGSIIGQGTSVKYLPSGQGTYSIELVAEGSYTTTTNETYDVSVVSGSSNNVSIT